MEVKKKTGIMGGTFDPVHLAHTALAEAAFYRMGLDEIFFIPAHCAPLRESAPSTSDGNRLDMLKIALSDVSYKWNIELCEMKRGGTGYAVDTLAYLSEMYPNRAFSWIIGADHISKLKNWKNIAILSKMVKFICATRPDCKIDLNDIPDGVEIDFIEFPPMPHSSTKIRNAVRDGDEQCNFMLDGRVLDYILKNKLYKIKP